MNIVVLDGEILNPGDVSWKPLQDLGDLVVYDFTKADQVAARARDADVILVNKTELRRHNLPDLAKCQLVGVLATGANNIDLPDLRAAGIPVCNTPSYGVEDVAQHALALLMEASRNVGLHASGVLNGDWQKSGQWCYWKKTPLGLQGLTLGIIGFGAIGQSFGRLGHALGMRVLANARHQNANPGYPFEYASLEDIFRQANVLSLHCPLTGQTAGIINKDNLALMPDGAIIINTARGGLINENDVADALRSGKLRAFGADVLSSEPPAPDNPLLGAPNVLITPHMAWATGRARQKIIDIMADNVAAFFLGKERNIIN